MTPGMRLTLFAFIFAFQSIQVPAGELYSPVGKYQSRFLIVVDRASFEAAKDEIFGYQAVLCNEGLGASILAGDWKNPELLREEIRQQYQMKPVLEGIVLAGNIPVVRVQNFQHATTAFKMDEEKFPIRDASVTSDRFYDDLDLEFELIRQDPEDSMIFYYRLRENSPQKVCSDFYSARMLPPSDMGTSQTTLLKKYFRKVIAAHGEENQLDRFMIFNGHGYNSDCLTAWQNEQFAIREQIPEAFRDSRGNGFYNFRQDPFMKYKLFDKLQQEGTDLFVFHEHGDFDTQYINGEIPARNMLEYPGGNVTGPMSAFSVSVRNTFRRYSGERAEKYKQNMINAYGLTEGFFDPQRLDSLRKNDSIFAADINIVLKDLPKVKMQPRVTIFDACYNGSFHQPGYVAGYYVFGDGNTIVAQGNTVNVLQDKWSLELLGMLREGARVGFWQKEFQLLESHLTGDPTFRFMQKNADFLNTALACRNDDFRFWKKYLKSSNPNLQSLAIKKLSVLSPEYGSRVLPEIFRTSKAYSVRMEALKQLLDLGGEEMVEAISLGLNDPYEMIRRVSARYAGFSGDGRLIRPLVSTILFAAESQRVQYSAQVSLEMFDLDEVIREVESQSPGDEETAEYYRKRKSSQEKSLGIILDNSAKPEERVSAIRSLRNYNNHKQVTRLLEVLQDKEENPDIRIKLAEALGWFERSIMKKQIAEALAGVYNDRSSPGEVRNEALQSLGRLDATLFSSLTATKQ
jgi:HEAT repeat protein